MIQFSAYILMYHAVTIYESYLCYFILFYDCTVLENSKTSQSSLSN